MEERVCDERHENCNRRMDSHSKSIEKRIPWRVFYWTFGIAFALIFGSYGYTKTVAKEVAGVVKKSDMESFQKTIIEAIKAAK